MRRIELPGGAWADLRDKEEITTRDRRAIRVISVGALGALGKMKDVTKDTSDEDMASLGFTEAQMDAVMRLEEATVKAFVAAWSLPDPPTLESIGDLPVPIYDALKAATAKDGAALALDTSPGEIADPKGLSGDSGPSDGLLRVSPEPTPILT